MVIVVAEQRDGRLSRASWEAVAAGQAAADADGVTVILLGGPDDQLAAAAEELSQADVREVCRLEHPALAVYTPDGYTAALQAFLATCAPSLVVLPHTYQTRDFAPQLAARIRRAIVTDVAALSRTEDGVVCRRPMFQGKLSADVVPQGQAPHFVTIQLGAFRADQAGRGAAPAPQRLVVAAVDQAAIRQRPEAPFQEARQQVDLSQAARIVSVGRGIKAPEHLAMIRNLAEAMSAEVAASRPICDAGWLPMEHQVGSSGQTVAPKLYLALGISGAIQHLVGMKGSQTIVAVNKDPDAPIFEVADYGVVGDLFEIVPALLEALKS